MKYEDHKGLLMKFAMMFYGRVKGAGITSMDFDDVLSEMNVAFSIAVQPRRMGRVYDAETGQMVDRLVGYDPDMGITFTAYLGRACLNHMNKLLERLEREHFGRASTREVPAKLTEEQQAAAYRYVNLDDKSRHYGLGYVLLGDITVQDSYSDFDVLDVLMTHNGDVAQSPEDIHYAKRSLQDFLNNKKLPVMWRLYVSTLVSPDIKLDQKTVEKLERNAAQIRAQIRGHLKTA